ncbi:g400 [Coccomyxa viridis]|uniref:G400 protein n=1 Tax=Coccomyxa viridis TaxID=1274662 RepID=A0ABP1FIJ6_9CHLO
MRSLFFGSEVQPDHVAAFTELKAAFGEHSDVEKALRRAGEPGLQDKGGWDALLARYLRAEKYNVQKAEKRLRDQAVWRSAFCPKGQFSEDEFRNELAAQKVFLQGPDKHGRGVIILKASRHSKSKRDLEETKRCICYTLDHQIKLHDLRLNPDAKGFGIFDLRDITMDCLDFGALHAVFDILQNYYPERLAVMVMFCAPFIFGALWKAVSPFIDPDTKKKVVFVNSSNAKAEIGDIFEPKDLPELLGGSAPLIPVEDAVAALKANQK